MSLRNTRSPPRKKNRLRGYAPSEGRQSEPESDRHLPDIRLNNGPLTGISPHKNDARHEPCHSNVSPRFPSPGPGPRRQQRPPWNDQAVSSSSSSDTQSPKYKQPREKGVNYGMVLNSPYYSPYYCPYQFVGQPSPRRSPSRSVPSPIRKVFPFMASKELNTSDRRYLLSLASIYSVRQMKQLKQEQYKHLLLQQYEKGFHSTEEYRRYMSYIDTPRKQHYDKSDGSDSSRHRTSSGSLLNRRRDPQDSRPGTARSGDETHKDKREHPPQTTREAWTNGSESQRNSKPQKSPREKQREAIQKEAQKKRQIWLQNSFTEKRDESKRKPDNGGKDTNKKERAIKKDDRENEQRDKQGKKDSDKRQKRSKSKISFVVASNPPVSQADTSNEERNKELRDEAAVEKEQDHKDISDSKEPGDTTARNEEPLESSQEQNDDRYIKDNDARGDDTNEKMADNRAIEQPAEKLETSMPKQEANTKPNQQEDENKFDRASSSEKGHAKDENKEDGILDDSDPTERDAQDVANDADSTTPGEALTDKDDDKTETPEEPAKIASENINVSNDKLKEISESSEPLIDGPVQERDQGTDPLTSNMSDPESTDKDGDNNSGVSNEPVKEANAEAIVSNHKLEEVYESSEPVVDDSSADQDDDPVKNNMSQEIDQNPEVGKGSNTIESEETKVDESVTDEKSSQSSAQLRDHEPEEASRNLEGEHGNGEQTDDNVEPEIDTKTDTAVEIADEIKQDETKELHKEGKTIIDDNADTTAVQSQETVKDDCADDQTEESADVDNTKDTIQHVKPIANVMPEDKVSQSSKSDVETKEASPIMEADADDKAGQNVDVDKYDHEESTEDNEPKEEHSDLNTEPDTTSHSMMNSKDHTDDTQCDQIPEVNEPVQKEHLPLLKDDLAENKEDKISVTTPDTQGQEDINVPDNSENLTNQDMDPITDEPEIREETGQAESSDLVTAEDEQNSNNAIRTPSQVAGEIRQTVDKTHEHDLSSEPTDMNANENHIETPSDDTQGEIRSSQTISAETGTDTEDSTKSGDQGVPTKEELSHVYSSKERVDESADEIQAENQGIKEMDTSVHDDIAQASAPDTPSAEKDVPEGSQIASEEVIFDRQDAEEKGSVSPSNQPEIHDIEEIESSTITDKDVTDDIQDNIDETQDGQDKIFEHTEVSVQSDSKDYNEDKNAEEQSEELSKSPHKSDEHDDHVDSKSSPEAFHKTGEEGLDASAVPEEINTPKEIYGTNNVNDANNETIADVVRVKTHETAAEEKKDLALSVEDPDRVSIEASSEANNHSEKSGEQVPEFQKHKSSDDSGDQPTLPEDNDASMNITVPQETSELDDVTLHNNTEVDIPGSSSDEVTKKASDDRNSIKGDGLNDHDVISGTTEITVDTSQEISHSNNELEHTEDPVITTEVTNAEAAEDRDIEGNNEAYDEELSAKDENVPISNELPTVSANVFEKTEFKDKAGSEDDNVTASTQLNEDVGENEIQQKSEESETVEQTMGEQDQSGTENEQAHQESETKEEQDRGTRNDSVSSIEKREEDRLENSKEDEREEEKTKTIQRPSTSASSSSSSDGYSPKPPTSPREGNVRPRSRIGRPPSGQDSKEQ